MSATQLAAWIAAESAAVALGAGALWLVYSARPAQRSRFGLCAAGLGVLALTILGLGVALASPPAAPGTSWTGRCGPGLYDNGGTANNGPVCIPWSNGGPR